MTGKSNKSIYSSNKYDLVRGSGRLGQINGHSCGPHSLRQNLYKLGINYSERELYNIMGTTSDGTGHPGI